MISKLVIKSKSLDKISLQIVESVLSNELQAKDIAFIQLIDSYASHFKSLEVLTEAETYSSVTIISRVLFEHYIYMKYILEQDSEIRARRFLEHAKKERSRIYEDIYADTEKGKKIRDEYNLNFDEIKKLVYETAYMKRKEENNQTYKEILENKRNWFNHDGTIKSFNNLCDYLDEDVNYQILYQSWSLDIHARGNKHFSITEVTDQHGYLELITHDPEEINMVLHAIQILTMNIIRALYSSYGLKKELKLFDINLAYKLKK